MKLWLVLGCIENSGRPFTGAWIETTSLCLKRCLS